MGCDSRCQHGRACGAFLCLFPAGPCLNTHCLMSSRHRPVVWAQGPLHTCMQVTPSTRSPSQGQRAGQGRITGAEHCAQNSSLLAVGSSKLGAKTQLGPDAFQFFSILRVWLSYTNSGCYKTPLSYLACILHWGTATCRPRERDFTAFIKPGGFLGRSQTKT